MRVGPINAQAADVLELLTDPARCQVVLVTLPEETPVNELVETAFSLEDEVGVSLGPVVVNGLLPRARRPRRRPRPTAAEAAGTVAAQGRGRAAAPPPPTSAASASRSRPSSSTASPRRCPLPQLRLPFLFDAELGPTELDHLADRAARRRSRRSTPSAPAAPTARRP